MLFLMKMYFKKHKKLKTTKKNSNKFFLRKKNKNPNRNYQEIEKTRTKVTPQINRINIPNSSPQVIVMTNTPNSFTFNTKRKLDLNNKNQSQAKRSCYFNVTPVTHIINNFSNIKMHSPILSKSKFFLNFKRLKGL
jgi:hypothetical protein